MLYIAIFASFFFQKLFYISFSIVMSKFAGDLQTTINFFGKLLGLLIDHNYDLMLPEEEKHPRSDFRERLGSKCKQLCSVPHYQ